jgi:hypothetical protein
MPKVSVTNPIWHHLRPSLDKNRTPRLTVSGTAAVFVTDFLSPEHVESNTAALFCCGPRHGGNVSHVCSEFRRSMHSFEGLSSYSSLSFLSLLSFLKVISRLMRSTRSPCVPPLQLFSQLIFMKFGMNSMPLNTTPSSDSVPPHNQ